MITPEEFASIKVGDAVTVRSKFSGTVTAKNEDTIRIKDANGVERWANTKFVRLLAHTPAAPAWHRAKVIAATYQLVAAGQPPETVVFQRDGRRWFGTDGAEFDSNDPPDFSDVRVLVGEDEEL